MFIMAIALYILMTLFLMCRSPIWLFFKSVFMVAVTSVNYFNVFNIFINSFQIFLQSFIVKSSVSYICWLSLMSLPHDDLYSYYGFLNFSLPPVRVTSVIIPVDVQEALGWETICTIHSKFTLVGDIGALPTLDQFPFYFITLIFLNLIGGRLPHL